MGLSQWLSGKESVCDTGDMGSIPGSGRSSGRGNGNSFQYSCLGNTMDRGTWLAIVHGVTKSWIQLSEWTPNLKKRMKKQLLPLCWWRNKQFCTGQRYQNSDPWTVIVSDDLSKSCVCLLGAVSCPALCDHMDWSSPRTKSVSRTWQEQQESLSLQFKSRGANSPWEKSVMK